MHIYCADIGSTAKGRFAWASTTAEGELRIDNDIKRLAAAVAQSLNQGDKVALGFECPLFVPLRGEPKELTRARSCDGNRSWSAGAGAAVLAAGLTQVTWVLKSILTQLKTGVPYFLQWDDFQASEHGLFLWEAFVTGKSKGTSDADDAACAVNEFKRYLRDASVAQRVTETEVLSLIGAALVRSRWTSNPEVLWQPCLVLKPLPKRT